MHTVLARSRSVVTLLAAVAMLSMIVSGCRGCEVRPIPITIPFGNNIVIAEGVNGLPAGSFDNFTLPIGAEDTGEGEGECLLDSIGDLVSELESKLPPFLTRLVAIDRVLLQELRFEASSGNFNFLTDIEVTLITTGSGGGEQRHTLRGTPSGSQLVLTPVQSLDLWAILNAEGACIRGEITISGQTPQNQVVFNGELKLLLHLIFRP